MIWLMKTLPLQVQKLGPFGLFLWFAVGAFGLGTLPELSVSDQLAGGVQLWCWITDTCAKKIPQ